MPGHLFTAYFLTDGIKESTEWRESVSSAGELDSFKDGVCERYGALMRLGSPNEAVTEQEIIRPVLELLGWTDYLPQQGASGNEDIPDHLLFSDADSKERAGERNSARERYRDAWVVEESKRFGLSLDARRRGCGEQVGDAARPDTEILDDGGDRVGRAHPVGYSDQRRACGVCTTISRVRGLPGTSRSTWERRSNRGTRTLSGRSTCCSGGSRSSRRDGAVATFLEYGACGGEAVRGAGRSGSFEHGLHAGLSEAGGISGRARRVRSCRRCVRLR